MQPRITAVIPLTVTESQDLASAGRISYYELDVLLTHERLASLGWEEEEDVSNRPSLLSTIQLLFHLPALSQWILSALYAYGTTKGSGL